MKEYLSDDITKELGPYLHSIISEIRVSKNKVVVGGSNLQFATAISKFVPRQPPKLVPSHIAEWRARKDERVHWIEHLKLSI